MDRGEVELSSSDGTVFKVATAVACVSKLIGTTLEESAEKERIPFSNIETETLKKVIRYCEHHKDQQAPKVKRIGQAMSKWDTEFFDEIRHGDSNLDSLFRVLVASDYLQIDSLTDLCCLKLADMTKGETTDEIRLLFKLESLHEHKTAFRLHDFLRWLEPSEALSSLLKQEDFLGLAWLILYLLKENLVEVTPLVRSIDFSDCKLSPQKFLLLLGCLPKSVEELKFGRSMFDGEGCTLLCGFLKALSDSGGEGAHVPSLRRLWFDGCNLDDEKAKQLFPSLPKELEELNLEGNREIGSAGWGSLGARLKGLEGLKKLKLQSCNLDDETAKQLFPSLPGGLEELNLSFMFSDPGCA
uniref:SKP1 component POZ domain-containing protein n=1 Tax=Chromera velia CCMP2878 TaxID=1169474 RepID=A0A0G4F2E4_9ALVE|eukprot:Cvel_2649.t1-p1 / transcript=Cvel_2649.t1 / gene=Cvel_2649 / organism=Chromera_velia_CCMP2878 / gene_product=SKP1-like protein 11, putative / transcript_product=SKP1-like protein 11, putative / location=Cvel_scaffold105:67186-72282(-) / protein_length=355 / sequence_SO=supercontig / SO=protein_coding / is_pseudo=false